MQTNKRYVHASKKTTAMYPRHLNILLELKDVCLLNSAVGSCFWCLILVSYAKAKAIYTLHLQPTWGQWEGGAPCGIVFVAAWYTCTTA